MELLNVNSMLPRLQRWYQTQCNGEWEHHRGIKISTLDNPGWLIEIDLEGTPLAGRDFRAIERLPKGRSGTGEWISCKVEARRFKGAGGPEKLAELIAVFLRWAEAA